MSTSSQCILCFLSLYTVQYTVYTVLCNLTIFPKCQQVCPSNQQYCVQDPRPLCNVYCTINTERRRTVTFLSSVRCFTEKCHPKRQIDISVLKSICQQWQSLFRVLPKSICTSIKSITPKSRCSPVVLYLL